MGFQNFIVLEAHFLDTHQIDIIYDAKQFINEPKYIMNDAKPFINEPNHILNDTNQFINEPNYLMNDTKSFIHGLKTHPALKTADANLL
jgi:hypothetical protein